MTSRRKQIHTSLAFLAVSFATVFAQQLPTASGAKTAAFDVVSIKRSSRPLESGGAWGVNQNKYDARNIPFAYLILAAYFGGTPASADRIKNAPAWVFNQPYYITAKVDDATANSWKGLRQKQQVDIAAPMLRTMLEDRCKLVLHKVPTEIQGYTLVLGNRPLKLTPYQPNEPLPQHYGQFEGGWMIAYSEPGNGAQPYTQFLNATISEILQFLSVGGTPIIDRTGLTGHYDVKLFRSEVTPPTPAEDGSAPPPTPRIDPAHLFDWQAAGLELKPIKVPSFDLVIDHIEPPSEN